jgi:3,4-dihydroxy 2-butanone 4-phosphate synthase/GTP cyclohydrolase II
VDLARIAGLTPAGVICEIMGEDGTMSRVPQLIEFCREHNLKMLTVAELIRYRMQHERYVRRVAETVLLTAFGDFRMIAYSSDVDHDQHVALVRGELEGTEPALVRVHSHCLTGDVFRPLLATATNWSRVLLRPSPKKIAAFFLFAPHRAGFGISHWRTRLASANSCSRARASRRSPARQRLCSMKAVSRANRLTWASKIYVC